MSACAETPTADRSTRLNASSYQATFATGRQKLLGHFAMLAFAALVAGSFSLGAIAAPHLGPAPLNAVRFMFGTILMGVAATLLLRNGLRRPETPYRYAVLGFLMAVFFITMFIALRLTDPVSTGAVFTLMPLLAAFFGYVFLGQVPRGIVIASLFFAGLGSLWVIFRGDLDAMLAFDVGSGEAIFFIGVIGHAAYAPLVRRLNRGEPLLAFTFWTLLSTGLCIALYGVRDILATDWAAVPLLVWGVIGYLAVFTTAGTTFLVQFAALRLPASKVMAYTYLTHCYIILYEGLLGHGWASSSVLTGALITVMGLIVLALSRDS